MIIRIQRPIAGSDFTQLLLHNKDQSYTVLIPQESDLGEKFIKLMGVYCSKAYFWVNLLEGGGMSIVQRVHGQNW